MSKATAALAEPGVPVDAVRLRVIGVLNPRSLGVARYASRLAAALESELVEYHLAARPSGATNAHVHLANSSRGYVWGASGRAPEPLVTVHDVVPRTRALHPIYRLLLHPRLRNGAVVVHSSFAADQLVGELGRRPARLEIIPHAATVFRDFDRQAARRALGWPEDALIAVLPGVVKQAKLVREALAAVARAPSWRIALAGHLVDGAAREVARTGRALVLTEPDDAAYAQAVVASDCVLCLRRESVGETNGPLLDALGAARAVLATPIGSIPEVAGEAAEYCDGTVDGVERALARLADADRRSELEHAATERAAVLTWERSATAHSELFREVFDG